MGADRSQSIVYATVRDKVRQELPVIVDDPDFPEVFEFSIPTGAGINNYVAHCGNMQGDLSIPTSGGCVYPHSGSSTT